MIQIKTPREIAAMREGGKILAEILHELAISAHVGMATEELDIKSQALMSKYDVAPSFKGYRGYPASVCVSINEEVVHGIPGKRTLDDGDIIKIDCGIIHKGMHTDSCVAVMIGNVKPEIREFVNTVAKSLENVFKIIKPGVRVGDIGHEIQKCVESRGYSAVHEYTGHGVGKNLHEEPEIPNHGKKGKGPILLPGMVIAVEPIIAMGNRFVYTLKDDWTAVTRDSSPSCQVEHTIAITSSGYEVLTKYHDTTNLVYSQ
ncbi:type I methionyl aminopeptidase [Candidatus Peregrinibacteria bacterium]|nr:type I methionyl aminopeptidase [Candidatus Peregrinibacteria bacterium]